MRSTAWFAAAAILLSTVAVAGHQVAILDGTSWKVEVDPDSMAKEKGEKQFKETLTFAQGMVSMSQQQKAGFKAAPYTVSKLGDKDWTFKAEQNSADGQAVWTGTVHEKDVEGKLIWTKADGAVLTYTFKGDKLD